MVLLSSDKAVICILLNRKKMWRIAARIQHTKFSCSFKVTVHSTPNYHGGRWVRQRCRVSSGHSADIG